MKKRINFPVPVIYVPVIQSEVKCLKGGIPLNKKERDLSPYSQESTPLSLYKNVTSISRNSIALELEEHRCLGNGA